MCNAAPVPPKLPYFRRLAKNSNLSPVKSAWGCGVKDDGGELFFERKNLLRPRLEFFLRHRAPRMDFGNIGHKNRLPL